MVVPVPFLMSGRVRTDAGQRRITPGMTEYQPTS